MRVVYVATNGLVPYHSESLAYDFVFDTSEVVPPPGNDLKTKQESISGLIETCYYGERRIWSFTTIPMQEQAADTQLLMEFMRSTADGQTFTVDPYGNMGAVTAPLAMIREDQGFTRAQFQMIDGVNDYYQFSFKVREV